MWYKKIATGSIQKLIEQHRKFFLMSYKKIATGSVQELIMMRSMVLVWKWMMITYLHQRTSQHQMKKNRVLQVTGDSIGSVITGCTASKSHPQLENCNGGRSLTLLQFFEQLFPIMFLKDVIIANINKLIKGERMEYGEMLHFFGLWFLMSMKLRPQCHEHLSSAPVNEFEGTPF